MDSSQQENANSTGTKLNEHQKNESLDISNLDKQCEKLPKHLAQQLTPTIKQLFTQLSNIPEKQQNTYQPLIYHSLQSVIKRCTQPQINHINFNLSKGNNLNLYPVVGVIAWNDTYNKCPLINWKLCSWMQSGGVRCVPIVEQQCVSQTQTLKEQKVISIIKQQLSNIHALIIPSFNCNNNNPNQNCIKFLQILLKMLKQQQPQRQLNILSFGKSSQYILQRSCNIISEDKNQNKLLEKRSKVITKQFNVTKGKLVSIQNDTLFGTIDPVVQLKYLLTQVQFSSSIESLPIINWQMLSQQTQQNTLKIQSFLLLLAAKSNKQQQSYQLLPYFLKQQLTKNIIIYHCLIDVYTADKMQLFNKLIVNFVDQIKKKQYKVKNPIKYVAHYPLEFKHQPNKAFYKIVTNK